MKRLGSLFVLISFLIFSNISNAQSLVLVQFEYLSFETEEMSFQEPAENPIVTEYEIEDSLWLSLRGSYAFSSDLYGFFDLTTKQEEQGNNLKLLASLSKGDLTFRTRRGAFKGSFSQYVEGTEHQSEEVDTEYFSLDLQYSLVGIRYLNFQAPTILESPSLTVSDGGDLVTYSRDGLDPEFEFTGYEIFFQIDTLYQTLKMGEIEPDWYFGADFFLGVSEGKGKISQIGLENYELASGNSAEKIEPTIQLFEYQLKVGAARDLQFNGGQQLLSFMAGYGVSWLSYSTESGGEFDDLKVFQNIYQHGPYISVGAVF